MNIYQVIIKDGNKTAIRTTGAGSARVAVNKVMLAAKKYDGVKTENCAIKVDMLFKKMTWETFNSTGKFDEWRKSPLV